MSSSSSSRVSRRSFLRGLGACAVAATVATRPASARSTDEWVRLWELPADPPQRTPAVLDETVFVPSAAVVRAVDAETGDASWVRSVGDPIVREGVLAGLDGVYVGTESGTVHGLDVATGDAVWSQTVAGPVVGLLRTGGCLVVQTADAIQCLDAGDGTVTWRTPLDTEPGTVPRVTPVTDGTTVVGSGGTAVFAVAIESGAVRWTERRPVGDEVHCLAVWEEGVVVGGKGTTAMLTLESGARLWTRQSGARHLTAGVGSSVYAMGTDGTVAIDPGSGRTELSLPVRAGPDGGLAVGEVEPHGTVVTLSGERDGTPTVVVVDPGSGATLWSLPDPATGTGFGRAVLTDERLVVQDLERGVTVAYGEPSDAPVGGAVAATAAPGGGAAAGGEAREPGRVGWGLGIDTTIELVSVVLTIIGGLVGVAKYLHDREQKG